MTDAKYISFMQLVNLVTFGYVFGICVLYGLLKIDLLYVNYNTQ